jgi:threonine dehydrogenase-like Zn-dependent dehydrogenase
MRAVKLTKSGLTFDVNYPKPVRGPSESLIRVSKAGICSTDLELVKGYYPFAGVLGHEFVGVVDESSEARWVGQRVVCSINFANPQSPEYAEYGLEHHPHRSVLGIVGRDGAMADFVSVPTWNLFEVPSELTDEEAVFAEPLAAALRICEQVIVSPSRSIAVVGPGRLGLLVGQVLQSRGAEVNLFGRSETSLKMAQALGLEADLVDRAETQKYALVVDCTGSPKGLEHALRMVRPRGTLILKSTYAGEANINLTKLVVDEIQVVGSRCGPFGAALRCLARREVNVTPLIDGRYSLDNAVIAFEHAAKPAVRKILLEISDSSIAS